MNTRRVKKMFNYKKIILKYNMIILLLLILLSVSCANNTNDANIMRTVLESEKYIVQSNGKLYEIQNAKQYVIACDSFLPIQHDTTNKEYQFKANNSLTMESFPDDIRSKIVLVSEKILMFESNTYWDLFYEKYPFSTGLIRFSHICYNSYGNKAIIQFGYTSNFECGVEYIIYLKKYGSLWKIENKIISSIY